MRTLIVIASPSELELAKKEIEKMELTQVDILITGVGALNIMTALRDVEKDRPIFNVGYAGSVDIPIGKRVEVGKCTLYHPQVTYNEPKFYLPGGVTCYTSADFVTSSKKKGCVFDMELAYILAMGFTNIRGIKYVSDNCNYDEYVENSGNNN